MFCTNCGNKIEDKAIFCTECGTKVEKDNDGKTVQLIVTRQKKVIGCAIPFSIYVDGEKLGNLGNGKSLTKEVPLGNHKVEFRCVEKDVVQEVTVNNTHESVEVMCYATMGLAAAVAVIKSVSYK